MGAFIFFLEGEETQILGAQILGSGHEGNGKQNERLT